MTRNRIPRSILGGRSSGADAPGAPDGAGRELHSTGGKMSLRESFDKKYGIVEPSGCWVWTSTMKSNGYGCIQIGSRVDGSRRIVRAHRASWALHNGPIPDGLHVLHHCDIRSCVNPAHLFLGTNADNVRDREKKGRGLPSVLFGDANGKTKLTDAEVAEIRALAGRMLRREIAALYGVTQQHVSDLINGKRRVAQRTGEGAPGDRARQAGVGGKLRNTETSLTSRRS